MTNSKQKQSEWRVIGETVPGASHIRAGIPNQDAILQMRESGRSLPIIVSLSDGHGSDKCFRSDRGSRFAVKKAAQVIGDFLDGRRGNLDLAEIEAKGQELLSREFVKKWRKAVEMDLKNKPLTPEEIEKMVKKDGEQALKLIEENPFLPYGATSLTVAIEEDFILYLQLGDGEIVNVSSLGEVSKPLKEDARLFANETTSLCLPRAAEDCRFLVQRVSDENCPALILISTDGYVNSFADEAGFLQTATDFFEMLGSENGFESVSENLKEWLEEATRMGSGDDTTIGIIYRPEAAKELEKLGKSEAAPAPQTSAVTETSETITAPVGSGMAANENMEDVTVTITIKKDKNKISAPSAIAASDKQPENAGEKTVDKKSE